MTTESEDEACRKAFDAIFEGQDVDEVEIDWKGIRGLYFKNAWAACTKFHEAKRANLIFQAGKRFGKTSDLTARLYKKILDQEAKVQGLAQALRYIVDHDWAAGKPLWAEEFVDVARIALKKYEEKK